MQDFKQGQMDKRNFFHSYVDQFENYKSFTAKNTDGMTWQSRD